jgi:hypothetical protein
VVPDIAHKQGEIIGGTLGKALAHDSAEQTPVAGSMSRDATEFMRLRLSDDPAEQDRATREAAADDAVWRDVTARYPDVKIWVVRNKTIPIALLHALAADPDPKVRREVAGKRKLDDALFATLARDPDEGVRLAVLNNAKCPSHIRAILEKEDE